MELVPNKVLARKEFRRVHLAAEKISVPLLIRDVNMHTYWNWVGMRNFKSLLYGGPFQCNFVAISLGHIFPGFDNGVEMDVIHHHFAVPLGNFHLLCLGLFLHQALPA